MGKKKRKEKQAEHEYEDFGTCEIYCKNCDHKFEVEWEVIFDIQSMTHGYVGFHLNDVFLDCPICGKIVTGDDDSYI